MIKVPYDRTSHTLANPTPPRVPGPLCPYPLLTQGSPSHSRALDLGLLGTCTSVLVYVRSEPGTPQAYGFPVLHARSSYVLWGGGMEEGPKHGKASACKHQSFLLLFLPLLALGLLDLKYIKGKEVHHLATNVSSLHRCTFKNSGSSLCSRLALPRKSKARSAKYTEKQHKSSSVSSPNRSLASDELGSTI